MINLLRYQCYLTLLNSFIGGMFCALLSSFVHAYILNGNICVFKVLHAIRYID